VTSAVLASRTVLTRRPVAAATLACVVVAAATLVLPINVTYDAWGWLVWGREITNGTLDTTGGPSWKPLPVIPAVLVAGLGPLAPAAWLVLSRAVGLMAIVVVYRLAARWGGRLAGVVAATSLVLTPDVESQFARLVLEGHIEPVTVTLALWAIERHLDGHRTQALLLCTAVALSRPEAWPFLGVYAAWLWWRAQAPRWLIVLTLITVPTLWFGGDWWGSGDWWHGADVAQVSSGDAVRRLGRAGERAAEMLPWPLWIPACVTVVMAWRRRQREQLALVAIAVGWTALVITMSVAFRFAALGRFFLVGAGIACVCVGLGVATIVEAVRDSRRWALAVGVLLVVCAFGIWPRAHILSRFAEETAERARFEHDLDDAIASAGGRDAVLACGPVVIENAGLAVPARPALAWKLDVTLSDVWSVGRLSRGVTVAQRGSPLDLRLSTTARTRELGHTPVWAVFAIECPP
jgi:hypothetical protein